MAKCYSHPFPFPSWRRKRENESKSKLYKCNFVLVVAQSYEVEADNEYVIRGNSAIMKCEVPSFVSDFVVVENWQDSNGRTYLPGFNEGKFCRYRNSFYRPWWTWQPQPFLPSRWICPWWRAVQTGVFRDLSFKAILQLLSSGRQLCVLGRHPSCMKVLFKSCRS